MFHYAAGKDRRLLGKFVIIPGYHLDSGRSRRVGAVHVVGHLCEAFVHRLTLFVQQFNVTSEDRGGIVDIPSEHGDEGRDQFVKGFLEAGLL